MDMNTVFILLGILTVILSTVGITLFFTTFAVLTIPFLALAVAIVLLIVTTNTKDDYDKNSDDGSESESEISPTAMKNFNQIHPTLSHRKLRSVSF